MNAPLLEKSNGALDLILDILTKRLQKLNEQVVLNDKACHEAMMMAHTVQQIQLLARGKDD